MRSKRQGWGNLSSLGLFFFLVFFSPVICRADTEEQIHSIILKIESKYSIKLFYKNIPKATWGDVTYINASQSDRKRLLEYLKIFDEEFNKYPKEFINRTKLKCVAFVRELSLSGQLRAAVPDYCKEILFLDFARGMHSGTYQRHVVHHEFYHMIEEQFNGNAYWKDPNWAKLNDTNFKYGMGGALVQGRSDMYSMSHPKKGFINLYSMSALEEDKAEVYASLFIKTESQKVSKWIKEDDILRKKVEYMKGFLFNCCEEMNTEYWEKLSKANTEHRDKDNTTAVQGLLPCSVFF